MQFSKPASAAARRTVSSPALAGAPVSDQACSGHFRQPRNPGSRALIDFLKARAGYLFNRDKPKEFQFRTPSTSEAIRGTEFNVAIGPDGQTTVTLIDGEGELSNQHSSVTLTSGEQANVAVDHAPTKTAALNTINIIQWTLYYPAVVDLSELDLHSETQQALSDSLAAYSPSPLRKGTGPG